MGIEVLYGVAAAILLAGLVWGVLHSRQRTAAEKHMTDETTKDLYHNTKSLAETNVQNQSRVWIAGSEDGPWPKRSALQA